MIQYTQAEIFDTWGCEFWWGGKGCTDSIHVPSLEFINLTSEWAKQ